MADVLIAGIDVAVAAVVDLLQSVALADHIARVQLDRADGLPMYSAFEKVFDYEIDPETVGERFIAIVTGDRGDRDVNSDRATDDTTYRLHISITLQGDDSGVMTKQVQRAVVAVRECIREHLANLLPYTVRAGEVRVGDEEYMPIGVIPGDNLSNVLMKAGTLAVVVPMIA